MAKSLRILVLLAAVTFLAAACGDPSEDHRAAIDQAVPTDLAFAEPSDAVCIRTAIETKYTLEGLDSRGLDTESLLADAADLTVLFDELDDMTIELAYGCIDADQRLVDHVKSQFEMALTPGCVDGERLRSGEIAATVLDGRDIAVKRDLRDVVRGCLTDDDFSTMFGLDNPAELAAALEVAPIDQAIDDEDVASCVGSTIVESLGAERLNDAEISIAQPDPFAPISKLDTSEQTQLLDALVDCDALQPMLIAKGYPTEPQAAECAVNRLSEEAQRELFNTIRNVTRRWERGSYALALDTCIKEELDSIYGDFEPLLGQHAIFVSGLKIGMESDPFLPELNRFEDQCMSRYFTEALTPELLAELEAGSNFYSLADISNISDGLIRAIVGSSECYDPMRVLEHQMDLFELSDDSTSCVLDDLPYEVAKDSMNSVSVLDGSNGEEAARYLEATDEIWDRIDDCATERELLRIDEIFWGPEGGSSA